MTAPLSSPRDGPTTGVVRSFELVWDALADVIGTAAAAALVRRAARRACVSHPALVGLTVTRKAFTPEYSLPQTWVGNPEDPAATQEFQAWFEELAALLRDLTGAVVLRRLESLPLPAPPRIERE